MGKYGRDIGNAYEIWQEEPHNWHSLSPRILRDLRTSAPVLEIVLRKMNGEEYYLRGSGTGVLELTSTLIRILKLIPEPRGFDDDGVARFVREATELICEVTPDRTDGEVAPADQPSTQG